MLFAPKEKGQGLVEYMLILVLVAIVVIAVIMILGPLLPGVGRFLSGVGNFVARYWLYGLGIFVFTFLGCLFALSVDRWRNGR